MRAHSGKTIEVFSVLNILIKLSCFRYTKDAQFNRLRSFNLADMLSVLLDNSEFYMNKAVDAANNVLVARLRNNHWKYVMKLPKIDLEEIEELGSGCFLVPSETQTEKKYLVDMEARSCSCPAGVNSGPCKHKMLVSHAKNLPSFDVVPTNNPQMRQVFMFLGTGKSVALDWFLPHSQPANTHPSSEIINIALSVGEEATANMEIEQPHSQAVVTFQIETASEVNEKLERVLLKLQRKIAPRIEMDTVGYSKALDIIEKTIDRLPGSVDTALQKSLAQFGKSVTQSSTVMKRKKLGMIPVQVTAKSRRAFKIRGSRTAPSGRPRKGQSLSLQMNLDDDEEDSGILRHKLPSKKKQKGSGNSHNLMASVSAGKGPSKKH